MQVLNSNQGRSIVKTFLSGVLALVLGMGVGGVSAVGVNMMDVDETSLLMAKKSFVPAIRMTAPLVFEDGRLASYITFDVQLEVASNKAESVKDRLPLLMHAVNLRTYRNPLASGPDGMIPDIGKLRQVINEAATETYGKDMVHRVVVTQATPI